MAKKAKKKLSGKEKEELVAEGELPKKSVRKSEDRQLAWFVVVIVAVFVVTLGTYSWFEGLKSFEFGGVAWAIEDYGSFDVYHARFMSLNGDDLFYNLYLRNDPRRNKVPVEGEFGSFKYGGYISLSQEFEACRGDVSRVMVDLGSFLQSGLGMSQIDVATSDAEFSLESGVQYANCWSSDTFDRSVFMIDVGENRVVQDEANRFCYTIYVEDCDDILSIEKFMTEIVADYLEEGD